MRQPVSRHTPANTARVNIQLPRCRLCHQCAEQIGADILVFLWITSTLRDSASGSGQSSSVQVAVTLQRRHRHLHCHKNSQSTTLIPVESTGWMGGNKFLEHTRFSASIVVQCYSLLRRTHQLSPASLDIHSMLATSTFLHINPFHLLEIETDPSTDSSTQLLYF